MRTKVVLTIFSVFKATNKSNNIICNIILKDYSNIENPHLHNTFNVIYFNAKGYVSNVHFQNSEVTDTIF